MTNFRNLTKTGNVYRLTNYLGNQDTTIVDGGEANMAMKNPSHPGLSIRLNCLEPLGRVDI